MTISTYTVTGLTLTDPEGRECDLDDVMGLSEPAVLVECDDEGAVMVTHLPGLGAPESFTTNDDEELAHQARAQGWTPLTGFTGQHGYNGPVMHPSEYIGGGLARHILDTPGQYAVATVDDDDGEAYGWVVMHRACVLENTPTRCFGDLVLIYHGRPAPAVACERHAGSNLQDVFATVNPQV